MENIFPEKMVYVRPPNSWKSVEETFYEKMDFIRDFLKDDFRIAMFKISTSFCDNLDQIYNDGKIKLFTKDSNYDFYRLKCDFRGRWANLRRSLMRFDIWLDITKYGRKTKRIQIPKNRQVLNYLQYRLPNYAGQFSEQSKILSYEDLMDFQSDFFAGLVLPVFEIMQPDRDHRSKIGSL